MEISDSDSPRMLRLDHKRREALGFELEPYELGNTGSKVREPRSMSALQILRETVRILRYNAGGFMAVTALLICPVSAVFLSNVLVGQSLVRKMTISLLLIAKWSGLPLWPFVKHSCQKLAEIGVSWAACFPLYITISLLAKAAVVYSVDCSYSRKQFDSMKFMDLASKIWRRLVWTYACAWMATAGCVTVICIVLAAVSNALSACGAPPEVVAYAAVATGMGFSVIFAQVVVVCGVAVVISVLEEVSGIEALVRSWTLIQGQTHVGLVIFLGSTMGTAFVQGLFEHRVKTLSYGDGSSRLWEGPLLVLMNSFVVLVDWMMSAVFYYSCRSSEIGGGDNDLRPSLDSVAVVGGESEIAR